MNVADVGEDAVLVHDEHRTTRPSRSRCRAWPSTPTCPTPVGVFRAVQRPSYEAEVQQSARARPRSTRGPGDLRALIESAGVWDVA